MAERLESTRRSYTGDADAAEAAFSRLADELVENAVSEFTADGFVDAPRRHAELLRAEVRDTFLPRYTRLATEMTAREQRGYGLGILYGPVGRIILFIGVLLIGATVLRAPGPWGVKLAPMIPIILAFFVPDLLAWAARRRYRKEMVELLEDMKQIQERAGDYVPAVEDEIADEPPVRAPNPPLKAR